MSLLGRERDAGGAEQDHSLAIPRAVPPWQPVPCPAFALPSYRKHSS